MYLSRLTLNHSRRALQWVARPYRVHQRLSMACGIPSPAPWGPTGDGAPFPERLLFRIDADRDATTILMQTPSRPDWAAAFGDFPVLASPPECREIAWAPANGEILPFRLRANPTRRHVCDGPEQDGKKRRVAITDETEQLAWLARKGEQAGFRLLRAQVRQDGMIKDTQTSGEVPRGMTFYSVQFDGALQVADAKILQTALAAGIGTGRALGFGLLSLPPPRGG